MMRKIVIVLPIFFLIFSCTTSSQSYKNTYFFNGNLIDATYGYYIYSVLVEYAIYDVTDKVVYSGTSYTDKYGYFEVSGKHSKTTEDLYKLDIYFSKDYYVTQRRTSYYNDWSVEDGNVSFRQVINLKRR